jgi:hypothetical protein
MPSHLRERDRTNLWPFGDIFSDLPQGMKKLRLFEDWPVFDQTVERYLSNTCAFRQPVPSNQRKVSPGRLGVLAYLSPPAFFVR